MRLQDFDQALTHQRRIRALHCEHVGKVEKLKNKQSNCSTSSMLKMTQMEPCYPKPKVYYSHPCFRTYDNLTYPFIYVGCLLINFPANKERNLSKYFYKDHTEKKKKKKLTQNWQMNGYKKSVFCSFSHSALTALYIKANAIKKVKKGFGKKWS